AVQERTKALQGLQGQARKPGERGSVDARSRRDANPVFRVREGYDRTLPSDAGAPGVLQGVLPAAQVRWSRRLAPYSRDVLRSLSVTTRGPGHVSGPSPLIIFNHADRRTIRGRCDRPG